MAELRYACGRCGTFLCPCGGQRPNTDVDHCVYPCPRCRGRAGVLIPTMHTTKMWRTHNSGGLPAPYAYGKRPAPEEWAEGFGPRTVPPVLYRGVPMPDRMINFSDWRMGVDAALEVFGVRER